MRTHLVMDMLTGEIKMQGRDKRLYSEAEIVRAEENAKRGDPEALSVLDNLNHELPGKIDVVDMEQILHDCPECREAMARGEKPIIVGPNEIAAMMSGMPRQPPRRRKKKRR